jgi:hypothetical protein
MGIAGYRLSEMQTYFDMGTSFKFAVYNSMSKYWMYFI